MMNWDKKYIVFCLMLFLFTDCKKNESSIPNVSVDFEVFLNLPQYATLNSPGNYMYLPGGYKGIILYRETMDLFIAYDQACSYEPTAADSKIHVDSTGLGLIDQYGCGSKFNILNGDPTKGPASNSLRRYAADFDGVSVVHIHN